MPGDTELHKAANQGEELDVKDLLDSVPVDAPGAQGRTALHRALGAGHKGVAEILVEHKADVTLQDSCARTSLHWAALGPESDSALACLQLLFQNDAVKALIDKQSKSGATPLHCALTRSHTDAVRLLVEKGANKTLKDEDGKTAENLAKEAGKDMVKVLKGKK